MRLLDRARGGTLGGGLDLGYLCRLVLDECPERRTFGGFCHLYLRNASGLCLLDHARGSTCGRRLDLVDGDVLRLDRAECALAGTFDGGLDLGNAGDLILDEHTLGRAPRGDLDLVGGDVLGLDSGLHRPGRRHLFLDLGNVGALFLGEHRALAGALAGVVDVLGIRGGRSAKADEARAEAYACLENAPTTTPAKTFRSPSARRSRPSWNESTT